MDTQETTKLPPPAHLVDAVRRLAAARSAQGAIGAELQVVRAAWEQDNAALLQAVKDTAAATAVADAELRALVLAHYRATGEKAAAPGCGVRLVTALGYDNKQALEWAKGTGMALVLDTKAFEQIAKASPGSFPFVVVEQVPQATVATDLDEALALAEVITADAGAPAERGS